MGFLTELLENDKEGHLRRHIFRVVSTLGYVIVIGMMLFMGSLIWRMLTGAEVEFFGLRVANSESSLREDADKAKGPKAAAAAPPATTSSPPATGLAPAANPVSTPSSPPAQPPGNVSVPQLRLLTAWVPMAGGLDDCMQVSNETLNRAQVSNVQRLAFGWSGQFRKDGATLAQVSVRCIPVNGFSIAFLANSAASETTNGEVMDAILREYNIKTGNVPLARLGGAATQISEQYYSLETSFDDITACRDFAKKVYEQNKAQIRAVETSAVFATLNGIRTSALCIRDGTRISAMVTALGFWNEEALRVRDAIVRDFLPMKRPSPTAP